MIVKTKLTEIKGELAPHVDLIDIRGQGAASFIYAVNKGRAVEISENNRGYWLEFWEKTDDEDAAPVKDMTVESGADAVRAALDWLR